MNKYSFAAAKIGDIFVNVIDGGLYQLDDIKKNKYYSDTWDYVFIELATGEKWTHTKKWFMKKLKPANEQAQILYGESDAKSE